MQVIEVWYINKNMEYNIFLSRQREEKEKNVICKEYYLSHHAIKICGLILGLFHILSTSSSGDTHFKTCLSYPSHSAFGMRKFFNISRKFFIPPELCVRGRASESECALRHSQHPISLTSGVVPWGQRLWMLISLSHGYFNLHWQLLSGNTKIQHINTMNQRITTGRKQASLCACR